ncbi:hypothetical protein DIS24_g5147 [Lasiodiplodia hormozganensis]|uniref:Heterokaryon incompatibility domain-containing protein n=1 Tax=Lasiodiplodia hormozganensis TaxID=869390 RepID=A0AA39YN85_9PEZI|nr:hypothetical protein DIS24_g5147 [Lasiodiplodia hormozganensis]
MQQYQTKHTTQPCGCSFIGVDYDQIIQIIQDGGVPLISVQEEAGRIYLKVEPRTLQSRYTAMSHVWCDGLGNPSANALPECQLAYIDRCLRQMPRDMESGEFSIGPLSIDWNRQCFRLHPEHSPPLFWMDTLCIPVKPEDAHLRTQAINQMASIYAAAVQVLVLDAELQQCSTESSASQILARIVCSAWMGRSWTLQEGVLARECVFQFADTALDPIHAWCLDGLRYFRSKSSSPQQQISFPPSGSAPQQAIYQALYNAFWDALHQDWKSSYRRDPPARSWRTGLGGSQASGKVSTLPTATGVGPARDARGLDAGDHFTMGLDANRRVKQLVDTWNELAHRSTTMPEDLHVIVANLLDFNADAVMGWGNRAEERMLAMMLSFEKLPVSLFWNSKGRRWDGGGRNGWVPVEPSKSALSASPVMDVREDGLRLDLEGGDGVETLLLSGRVDVKMQSVIRITMNGLHELTLLPQDSDRETPTFLANNGGNTLTLDDVVIFERALSDSQVSGVTRGALFRQSTSWQNQAENASGLRLIYICPLEVRQVTENDSTIDNSSYSIYNVRRIPTSHCIIVDYGT